MPKYRVNFIDCDGELEQTDDQIFSTYEQAENFAQDMVSSYEEEIEDALLLDSDDEFGDDVSLCDYEIIEVEDDE